MDFASGILTSDFASVDAGSVCFFSTVGSRSRGSGAFCTAATCSEDFFSKVLASGLGTAGGVSTFLPSAGRAGALAVSDLETAKSWGFNSPIFSAFTGSMARGVGDVKGLASTGATDVAFASGILTSVFTGVDAGSAFFFSTGRDGSRDSGAFCIIATCSGDLVSSRLTSDLGAAGGGSTFLTSAGRAGALTPSVLETTVS